VIPIKTFDEQSLETYEAGRLAGIKECEELMKNWLEEEGRTKGQCLTAKSSAIQVFHSAIHWGWYKKNPHHEAHWLLR
jgi:hypothetical protein